MKKSLFLSVCLTLVAFAACEKPYEYPTYEEEELPALELLAPAADTTIELDSVDEVVFEWTALENINSFKLLFSQSADMSSAKEFAAPNNPMKVKAKTMDEFIAQFGLAYEETGTFYWTVAIWGDKETEAGVNKITFKRKKEVIIPYEERVAEPITIPVAILIEDPVYNGRIEEYKGKRITEIPHKAWGRRWYDPKVQMQEFERDMEASSNGVVQYEVVKVIEADRLFSYFRDEIDTVYVDVDTLVNYVFQYNERNENGVAAVDVLAYYDYVGMMQHYGFDKMVDAGEIKEVWVYTHPASGMNESRLIGEGAFWCNSGGITPAQGATNTELCCVMFCNYERTTDLAMHSYAHRVESIMSQVYEQKGGHNGWNYKDKTQIKELTNWEKFSAHNIEYEKYKEGYAHIGMCHFPPNATEDYDYGNTRKVKTYADTWRNYPNIKEDDSVAREVDKTEWADAGGDQWGYMKWYFGHIPHFKGLCPRDGHLNNWWHYIVDYNAAMVQERRLANE